MDGPTVIGRVISAGSVVGSEIDRKIKKRDVTGDCN